ncbi:Uncharacterised protein [Serratia fonticola]|uniref:Uncharacterized protein n=1 Tax=Serratia fonticola TaxID=47917 RepID=A0A4U9UCW4_SERFO|nr:Uncharacterised protein [Serratia fonticola]
MAGAHALSASLLALIAALSLPYIALVFDWSDPIGQKLRWPAEGVLAGRKGWQYLLLANCATFWWCW